jgi:predicted transcriptional regulator
MIQEANMTKLDRAILETLQNLGGWATRSELSESLGVQMSQYHFDRIDNLEDMGLVEKRSEKRGAVGSIWFYRSV